MATVVIRAGSWISTIAVCLAMALPARAATFIVSNTNVAVDLDGDPRPQGAGFDIGCYEKAPDLQLYLPLIGRQT